MDESEKRRAYRLIEQLKTAGTPPREDNVQKNKPKSSTSAQAPAQDMRAQLDELRAQLAEAREKAEVAQGRLDQLTAQIRAKANKDKVNAAVLQLLMEGVRPEDRGTGGFSWQELGHARKGGPYYYIAGKWLDEDEGCRIIDSFFHRVAPSVAAPG